MKRWTFRILLCMFLGVVTTVGVAWGCVTVFPLGPRGLAVASRVQMAPPRLDDGSSALVWDVETSERFGHAWIGSKRRLTTERLRIRNTDPPPEDAVPAFSGFDSATPEFTDGRARFDHRFVEASG